MIKIETDDVARWRIEIETAEKFKDDNFGVFEGTKRTGVGENIDYLERGDVALGLVPKGIEERPYYATLNIIYAITKNIVPSLYYRNPKILAFPKRKQDENSAPVAAALLNYYFNELGIKGTNELAILDAYLLGMGVTKIGYATQFGMDIPDETEKKRKEKSRMDKIKEFLGLKKPPKDQEEEKPQNVELQENIIAESPYVVWVNPFNFLIDPRATSIYDAQWVAQKILKTVDEVKRNKNFKNTQNLNGIDPENKDIPITQLDRFKTIELYEIHYKTEEGIYILILAKDGQKYEYLYHDKSIYEMDGFQFELLTFNKHGHKLYPCSDVDVIKPLQDRLNVTFDAILDQVDKFVSKLAVNETTLTQQGKLALTDGNLGSIVYTNTNPAEVFKEITLHQLKADMLNLVNQIIDIIVLESGLTKAQLTGLSSAETATEAQIGQGGANIRLSARAEAVSEFSNRQARKLWQVIRQFVDLDEIELITGEEAIDEAGIPRFKWLNDKVKYTSESLGKAELEFQIEVGSSQKPDLAVVRKEWENFINIMAKTDVIALLQAQGKKLDIGELIRLYLRLFPEMIKDIGRIIVPLTPQVPGQLSPEVMMAQLARVSPGGGNGQAGIRENILRQQTPTATSMQESVGGEAGML